LESAQAAKGLRRLVFLVSLFAALLLWPRTGRAGATETQVHLITMGPGEHMFTRAGHAAVMDAYSRLIDR